MVSHFELESSPGAEEYPRPAAGPATEIYTCWHDIGVYGNGQCAELQKFVHCRNCPVYSNAGLQLLDRALPEDYRREWTVHFAQPRKFAGPAKASAVLFRIETEWLALPARAFQEVAERRIIHSLPHRRQGIVLGLVNVRGELLIAVCLGRLLGISRSGVPPTPRSVYERLLVMNCDGHRFVFPVDEVQGIHRFQADELKASPATLAKSNAQYAQGVFLWQQRAVGLLDAERVFTALNGSLS
jgi:chemotaxis-related protein WspD